MFVIPGAELRILVHVIHSTLEVGSIGGAVEEI